MKSFSRRQRVLSASCLVFGAVFLLGADKGPTPPPKAAAPPLEAAKPVKGPEQHVVAIFTKVVDGHATVTPETAVVRSGQVVKWFTCCERLKVVWKRPTHLDPPRCEGGECFLEAPAVRERLEVSYGLEGVCNHREWKVDPRLIFLP